MSIRFLNIAWSAKVSPAQKLVLLSLSDQANDDGVCWPSVATIQGRTSMSERTVFRCLSELEQLGFVRRMQREGRSTYYLLLDPCQRVTPVTVAVTPDTVTPTPATVAPITINNHQNHHTALPAVAAKTANKNGTRLPANFKMPQEWLNFALERGLSKRQAEVEGDNFVDYWASKTGHTATKLDWAATWRMWIRKVKPEKQDAREKDRTGFIERHTDSSWADGL